MYAGRQAFPPVMLRHFPRERYHSGCCVGCNWQMAMVDELLHHCNATSLIHKVCVIGNGDQQANSILVCRVGVVSESRLG